MNKIKYIVECTKWFDTINGNTYFSFRATKCATGESFIHNIEYGYGDHYQHTAEKEIREKWGCTADYSDVYYVCYHTKKCEMIKA